MTSFTAAEFGQLILLFVIPFALLILTLVLGFKWGKPALEQHGDPEHPEAPAKRVPWLFFGYLLALILMAVAVRTLSGLLLAALFFARPLTLDVSLIPTVCLLFGLALGIFCRMRAVRQQTRS